jgi:hypothetical protein
VGGTGDGVALPIRPLERRLASIDRWMTLKSYPVRESMRK